jgi:radical SAM protein with 4Fe4S-binding SPASM domain
LTVPEWRHVLDELARAGTLLLVLIGGEAMMNPHFWEIASHAAEKNFALTLITNGLLIDEKAADRLADLGFYQVTVSVYSMRPEIHDAMTRRKGSLERALAAIERLRARGVGTGINCLLTRTNIEHCFEIEEWARARDLRVQFDPLVTAKSDGSLASTAERATAGQLREFYQRQKLQGRGPSPFEAGDDTDPVCNQGRGKCAVNAYGDLLTCLEIRDALGSLREKSFEELWHSDKARKLRGYRVKDLGFDSSCGDGAFCDHCPGMAGAETGDRMAPVPFLMELASIKRAVFEAGAESSARPELPLPPRSR